MKKNRLINSDISFIISKMGHTDTLIIADCGLPIPKDVKRIDIAIERNIPSFLSVLEVILTELVVEKITLAKEIKQENSSILEQIKSRIPINPHFISHEKLKEESKKSIAIIRTGEASPYANIILHSGVKF